MIRRFTVLAALLALAVVPDVRPASAAKPPKPLPSLSIADVAAGESLSVALKVTLNASSRTQVTVDYATVDGTANAGTDYVATSGTAVFPPGSTSQLVLVDLVHDGVDEPDERFTVQLANATGATIADGTGEVTILDDDEPAPRVDTLTAEPAGAEATCDPPLPNMCNTDALSEGVMHVSAWVGPDGMTGVGVGRVNGVAVAREAATHVVRDGPKTIDYRWDTEWGWTHNGFPVDASSAPYWGNVTLYLEARHSACQACTVGWIERIAGYYPDQRIQMPTSVWDGAVPPDVTVTMANGGAPIPDGTVTLTVSLVAEARRYPDGGFTWTGSAVVLAVLQTVAVTATAR